MTARPASARSRAQTIGRWLVVVTLVMATAGCSRPGAGGADPTPTYIPQPTPDPTMAAVVQGNAPPVAYLPPLEAKGSPTPVPAAGRPGVSGATASRPTPKPTGGQREPATVRGGDTAPKPAAAPTSAAPRPAPAPTAPRVTNNGSGTAPTGAGPAPAIINPNTALPGGPVRPNPTPGR